MDWSQSPSFCLESYLLDERMPAQHPDAEGGSMGLFCVLMSGPASDLERSKDREEPASILFWQLKRHFPERRCRTDASRLPRGGHA